VPTLSISENGILTAGATANNANDSTPTGNEFVGSTAPDLGFYSWRNFEVALAGSGPIRYEEVAVGPDTVLCVTWDGVEAPPTAAANPSTWQYQANLTTGTIDIVWQTWDPSTSTDDALVGVTLPGTTSSSQDFDPYSVTLATALPKTLSPIMQAVSYSASPAPIYTVGNPTGPIDWKVEGLADLSPILPGAFVATQAWSFNPPLFGTGVDLTFLGVDAPGCDLLLGSLDLFLPMSPIASTHVQTFAIPQPLSPGLTLYSQIINFIIPNSRPNGLNGFGVLTSNGMASRFDLQ
jgi:hypothetical protein